MVQIITILTSYINLKCNGKGIAQIELSKILLKIFKEDNTSSPNSIEFIKESVQKSTGSKILTEILDIRVMVKKTRSELPPKKRVVEKVLKKQAACLKSIS